MVRVGRAAVFPARFTLVAAMNPCPCGMDGWRTGPAPARPACRSGTGGGSRVRCATGSTSGWPSTGCRRRSWSTDPCPESSAVVAARIAAARERQRMRAGCAAQRTAARARCCGPPAASAAGEAARAIVLAEREGLSGRGTERLLRVARTIADLESVGPRAGGPPRRGRALPGPGRDVRRSRRPADARHRAPGSARAHGGRGGGGRARRPGCRGGRRDGPGPAGRPAGEVAPATRPAPSGTHGSCWPASRAWVPCPSRASSARSAARRPSWHAAVHRDALQQLVAVTAGPDGGSPTLTPEAAAGPARAAQRPNGTSSPCAARASRSSRSPTRPTRRGCA